MVNNIQRVLWQSRTIRIYREDTRGKCVNWYSIICGRPSISHLPPTRTTACLPACLPRRLQLLLPYIFQDRVHTTRLNWVATTDTQIVREQAYLMQIEHMYIHSWRPLQNRCDLISMMIGRKSSLWQLHFINKWAGQCTAYYIHTTSAGRHQMQMILIRQPVKYYVCGAAHKLHWFCERGTHHPWSVSGDCIRSVITGKLTDKTTGLLSY